MIEKCIVEANPLGKCAGSRLGCANYIYMWVTGATAADALFYVLSFECTTTCGDHSIIAQCICVGSCRAYLTGPAAVSSLLPSCTFLYSQRLQQQSAQSGAHQPPK
jgi:hypothetical protein